jgi:hypothetical protein
MSFNPKLNAIHILEQNLDKVNWSWSGIWENPAIFEEVPDYLLK